MEQSKGEITAEQVERARWRDELAAAEPVLPTPAEDSPERLRERREGIPWTLNEAAAAVSKTPSNLNSGCVPWQAADVSLCEGKSFAGPAYAQCRALYAAALSAEEARLAALTKTSTKPHMLPAFRKAIAEMRAGGASLSEVADKYLLCVSEVSEALDAEGPPERPAPRFKVGDLDPALHETALAATRMLHCGKWPLSLPRGYRRPAGRRIMSALDLNRLYTTIRRCAATLLDASYTDGIPTETTDVWRTIAADAARDLTDMIRRLRAAEAQTAWQPIETAPLGQWVLACYAHDGREPVVVRRRPVIRRPRSLDGSIFEDGHRAHRYPLTHWMPLPAPPASEVSHG